MTDFEEARERWIAECDRYAAFGKVIEDLLAHAVQEMGIWRQTSSRPKELHSLLKKLIKKPTHSYDTLPDKVGVRCVVRYLREADEVLELAQRLFVCSAIDKKIQELGDSRLGYLSIHTQVRLKPDEPNAAPFEGMSAELQIKTLGQQLWSEMSHDSIYKNDDDLQKLPVGIRRRVNLMAGLIEVADHEFDRLDTEIPRDDAHQLYKELECMYFKLSATRPDSELSIEVIRLLMPLYETGVGGIIKVLKEFYGKHEAILRHVYTNSPSTNVSALMFQPELLMLYERLEFDQVTLRDAWSKHFPERELERVANTLGISFD